MLAHLALLAVTNDSAIVGVGGTVQALDEATPIQMVSEHIEVDFAKRRVDTQFVFRNPGAATRVRMGFPEEGGGDIEVPTGERKTYFEAFHSWVDGQPANVELWRADGFGEEQFYRQWWTKTVDFGSGQARRVRNTYVTQYESDTMSIHRLVYILGTGRPWAGPIGHAKVVFDVSGVANGTYFVSNPKYTRRTGDLVVFEFKDFEPEELTFAVEVGAVGKEAHWRPQPGATMPGVGYVFRR